MSTSTTDRALQLLGSGIGPEQTAAALGVSVSRISQLLSDEHFATQVTELRFQNLQKHNARDASLDELEDQLIEKMRDVLPLMMRPMEILKALSVINAAKRRGTSAPEQLPNQQSVVTINMPTLIQNKFIISGNNQVVQAGSQQLTTIQSANLLSRIKEGKDHAHALSSGNTPLEAKT